jgi:hypothetical protein
MNKLTILIGLVALSALAAGVFGALHNQLSYSVGPSYFHELKFAQFGLSEDLHNRLGAALVGFRASWWMGVLMGLPALLLGFFLLARPQTLLTAGVGVLVLALLVTTLAVAAGLGFGVTVLDEARVAALPLPEDVRDPMGFARAGIMHDMAYYGGLAGAVIAAWTMWKTARAEAQSRGP